MNPSHLLLFAGLVLYAVAAVMFFGSFKGYHLAGSSSDSNGNEGGEDRLQRHAMWPFVAATVCMSASLFGILRYGYVQQTTGILVVTLISWLTIIGYYQLKMRLIGSLVAPFAIFVLLYQLFSYRLDSHVGPAPDFFAITHISLALIGVTFGILACVIAAIYLRHQSLLKSKKITMIPKYSPSLSTLDRYLFRFLWLGFSFLTLGLITGAIYAGLYGFKGQLLSPKTLWAFVVWGWYLAVLIARNVLGWPSRRIATMSLIGFFGLLVFVLGLVSFGGQA